MIEIGITNGEYGELQGIFYRIGSLLVYSFYISFKKQYELSSYAPLIKMDSWVVNGRYDITSRCITDGGIEKPVSVYIPDASDSFTINTYKNPIDVGSFVFSSGVIAIRPKWYR